MKSESKKSIENPMTLVKIEKIVLSCGAVGPDLEKSVKLLSIIAGRKAQIIASTKRIPTFNVRPGLEVGTRITIRRQAAIDLLKRLLAAIDNQIYKKQVSENHFSFGIKEYIEIPGMEYQREIGIKGLNVTVNFIKSGMRVKRKKIKSGRVPKKQYVSKEEIIKYMEEKFNTTVK